MSAAAAEVDKTTMTTVKRSKDSLILLLLPMVIMINTLFEAMHKLYQESGFLSAISSSFHDNRGNSTSPADAFIEKSPDLTKLKQTVKHLLQCPPGWTPVTEWELPPEGFTARIFSAERNR